MSTTPGERGETVQVEAKITLTLLCNNDCVFCYNRLDKDGSHILDEARVHTLIDEAADAGCTSLNFIGGEVTIVPYFERVLAHAGRRFDAVSINTNGRKFADPEFVRRCAEAGLTNVDVSLHGVTAAVHDRVSGAHGAFDDTTKGLRNLVAHGGPKVSVTTLVLDWNYPVLVDVGQLLGRIGVESWRVKYSYGALTGQADPGPADYIPRYATTLPAIRRAVEGRCSTVNVMVHDVPVCLLDDLLRYSSVFEAHQVARYTEDGAAEPVRVVDKWGTRSSRCDGCAAASWCCRVSPAYLALHGDDELRPLNDAEAKQAIDGLAVRTSTGKSLAANAEVERLDAAARAEDWRAVRDLAVEILARDPEHAEAARMQRRAEFRMLDRYAEAQAAAGDERGARKTRRYMERHYADAMTRV